MHASPLCVLCHHFVNALVIVAIVRHCWAIAVRASAMLYVQPWHNFCVWCYVRCVLVVFGTSTVLLLGMTATLWSAYSRTIAAEPLTACLAAFAGGKMPCLRRRIRQTSSFVCRLKLLMFMPALKFAVGGQIRMPFPATVLRCRGTVEAWF